MIAMIIRLSRRNKKNNNIKKFDGIPSTSVNVVVKNSMMLLFIFKNKNRKLLFLFDFFLLLKHHLLASK